MGKKLREQVERLAADPTAANRDAFYCCLAMSSVAVPQPRPGSAAAAGPRSEPMVSGADGEPMLLVYTDSHSVLRAPGVTAAGGFTARRLLEKALTSGAGVMVTSGYEATAPRAVVPHRDLLAVLAIGQMEDGGLGTIAWDSTSDKDDGFWRFEAGPIDGHSVAGVVVPNAPWAPLAAEDLPRIRQTVQWVRANDPTVRAHIAAQMWDWWYRYCGPPDREAITTPEQFRDRLELEVIRFEPGADAFLDYADHGLVSGYGIRIWVSADGRFTRGPEMG